MAETLYPHDPNDTSRPKAVEAPGQEGEDSFGLAEDFVIDVASALRANDPVRARTLVHDLHYADMAQLLERLDREDRALLVEAVRDDFNADILPELAHEVRDEVMDALGFEDFAAALEELDSDDAVYVAGKLDPEERLQILRRMPDGMRSTIEQGLAYGESAAGRLMQRELVAVPNYWTVGDTIDYLRTAQLLPEKFYGIFVVDPRHRPAGIVDLSRILRSPRATQMGAIVDPEGEVIPTTMDKEDVAFLFRQRNLTAAPVVDKSGRLIGQITIDDVVDVIDEEAGEDILKFAGVRDVEQGSSLYSTVMSTAGSRVSWLAVNLATAFLASSVVGLFAHSIEKLAALAVLMPICASMGGNAGTQTLATVVRSLATRELNASNVVSVAWKELFVGLINGVLFSAITGVIAYVWFHDILLGIVIAAAMILNMICAAVAGMAIPLILDKFGADPADSAVVFLTTVTDVVGFFSFLGLATWILL
jgi:magnesium transporter